MRARSLKPGFFKNELLGSVDPLIGTLFQGLWLLADRAGRLEDRPLRIAAELFPYRRSMTEKRVDTFLGWLHEHGFIIRYQDGEARFIQVLAFTKHQNPHKNERPSQIPSLNGESHPTSTVQAQCKNGTNTVPLGLTPSSLTPDSLFTDSPLTAVRCSQDAAPLPAEGRGLLPRKAEKTLEEREEELRKKGFDIWALPGEPGYCGAG